MGKCSCCCSLRAANLLIGLWQWLGVAGAITLMIFKINDPLVSGTYKYELPLMILCFYTVPAFAWFAAAFSPNPSVHRCYTICFFVSHVLVESYLLVLPILYYASQWSNTNMTIKLHPIFHNSGETLGQVTIKMYLIINSCVAFALMVFTTVFTCVLCAYTKELKEGKNKKSSDPAKEPLVPTQQKSQTLTSAVNASTTGSLNNSTQLLSSSTASGNSKATTKKKSNAMY